MHLYSEMRISIVQSKKLYLVVVNVLTKSKPSLKQTTVPKNMNWHSFRVTTDVSVTSILLTMLAEWLAYEEP